MHTQSTRILIKGFEFAEGLRWRNGQLWFCDLKGKRVYSVLNNHKLACQLELNDSPAAVGWLSDGRMLITSLFDRKLLSIENGKIRDYADLSSIAPGYGHDMVVSKNDTIYISASGFYPAYGIKPVKSNIMMIEPSGRLSVAVSQVGYPNGLALINDDAQMIVAETFAANLALYDVNTNGTLTNKCSFYSFDKEGFQVTFDEQGVPRDLSRYYPDGVDYDDQRKTLWVASPGKNQVLGIRKNQIQFQIDTQGVPFDCVVGGDNHDTLFIGAAIPASGGWVGQIEVVKLEQ
jgi:sugar lactone lactonase YvrE